MKTFKCLGIALLMIGSGVVFAGFEEVCNYGRDNHSLTEAQRFERVRYQAQFTKCMAGFDARDNAHEYMNNGLKQCFFYHRRDHRPAFKNKFVPCVKMFCTSFRAPMDQDCLSFNKQKKQRWHTKMHLK